MFKLFIGSAYDPVEVIASGSDSIRTVYQKANLGIPSGAMMTHNASRLGDRELDAPISSLSVRDGDMFTISEKLAGAISR